jgi:hypothetical protein
MPPPAWLKTFWMKNPNWIKRYQQTSTELNMILCDIPVNKKESIWTEKDIISFKRYMTKKGKTISSPLILYRGTIHVSPIMKPLSNELISCQFLSTSKSRKIAEEFQWKSSGYLHILKCEKGVKMYDMKDDYGNDNLKREKEVILLPEQTLILEKYKDHVFTWRVK